MGNVEIKVSGSILIYRIFDIAWDIDLRKLAGVQASEH